VLVIGIFIGAYIFPQKVEDYSVNLYTEVISVIFTIVVLDQINEYRDTQRLKRRLVREAGSRANNTAVSAIDWMRHEGWLTGESGLLKGADLHDAKLANANLYEANLEDANLLHANLYKANLAESNLTRAVLYEANLTNADLRGANLEGAYLAGTNLTNAKLNRANLTNADLRGAILIGANLQNAKLNNDTMLFSDINNNIIVAILPDGTKCIEDTPPTAIMDRFTDPNHPDFWRPPESD